MPGDKISKPRVFGHSCKILHVINFILYGSHFRHAYNFSISECMILRCTKLIRIVCWGNNINVSISWIRGCPLRQVASWGKDP